MAVEYLGSGNDDGVVLGRNASDLVGFHNATPVAQAATIADASVAHALNATFSDTEVEAALDALGTKINSVLTALKNKGIIASS